MKVKITVEGSSVQDVGYRLLLLSRARELEGFEAYNEGESLVVYIEGDDEACKRFIDLIKEEKPPLASVSNIKLEQYDKLVMSVKEFREQFNSEQLVKIAVTGVEMKSDIKEMKGDIKEMKGDIKEMKSDIKEMKGDIKEVLHKQDETIREIRDLRTDLKSWMDERLDRIEKDVSLIKQKIGL